MRVVLDTNILVSATQWNGSVADKTIRALHAKNAAMLVLREIITEFKGILDRDFGYAPPEIQKTTARVEAITHVVTVKTRVQFIRDDPADDNWSAPWTATPRIFSPMTGTC